MSNNVVVVIGSGRSGTSLTMQLLEAFGMDTSENMVGAKEQNPYGAYEDQDIFWLQERLQAKLIPNGMPPLDGWMDEQITKDTISRIIEILLHKLKLTSKLWGFKDPRTALFIPMWTVIFNKIGLIPKYILSVRDPSSVVVSMKRQYNVNEYVSEVFWLTKYTEALQNTGGNCFILHYEELLSEQNEDIVKELLDFTGLKKYTNVTEISNVIKSIIKINLNRAQFDGYVIHNHYVEMLYQTLKKCRGINFDRNILMSDVIKCQKEMEGFLGWAIEAKRVYQLKNIPKHNEQVQPSNELKKVIDKPKDDNEQLVLQLNEQLKELKDKNDEIENLKIYINYDKEKNKQIIKLKEENKQIGKLKEDIKQVRNNNRIIPKLEKENFELKTSASFRIGQVFVNAIAKPGANTILLPYNFLKIILEYIFVRRHL